MVNANQKCVTIPNAWRVALRGIYSVVKMNKIGVDSARKAHESLAKETAAKDCTLVCQYLGPPGDHPQILKWNTTVAYEWLRHIPQLLDEKIVVDT